MSSASRETENMFSGLWVALATPFREDGGLDLPAFRRLVQHCRTGGGLGDGVDGLLVLGSTGEAATLEADERDLLIAACLEEAGGLPVLVGTGSNATPAAARQTRRAQELGAAAALAVSPYYNKPNADGLVAHYEAVAAAALGLPIVLYNVPGRTGLNLTPEIVDRLWAIPQVVALKESSGDLAQIDEVVRRAPVGKSVLAGDDGFALASLAVGTRGLVSVVANLRPAETRALVDAARESRLEDARRHHASLVPLMDALFLESNPVPLKAALREIGLAGDMVRAPLARASEETRRRLASLLAESRGVAA